MAAHLYFTSFSAWPFLDFQPQLFTPGLFWLGYIYVRIDLITNMYCEDYQKILSGLLYFELLHYISFSTLL